MEPKEVKRRIEAARILRSMTQDEMDKRGHELGLDKQELGRTERGTLRWTDARLMVLCRVLRVPERWFTEDDVDEIVGLRDQSRDDALSLLEQALADSGLVPGQEPAGGASSDGGTDRQRRASEGGA